MKKIVLTTTAVLSLVATGATISSVNAASVPMVKEWSPAANAYVEVPAIGYRDTDLVATDVTLVEKRKAQLGAFSKGNSEFVTVDYVDSAYQKEFSKQFASFESNGIATFNGKTIVFKATDYGIYTMKFELDGVRYKLTADVRENVGKGAPFYTYVTKLEVLSTNQTSGNTTTPASSPTTPTPTKTDRWVQAGSRWWFKGSDGSYPSNGWEKIDKVWYHFDSSGWMQTGWVKDSGNWYYLGSSGAMKTGWLKDNGSWYYLDGSGAMKTGWLKHNGSWYYLDGSGAMKTGWMKVSGKWYYAYSSGALAVNTTTPDGYRVNYNGEWV